MDIFAFANNFHEAMENWIDNAPIIGTYVNKTIVRVFWVQMNSIALTTHIMRWSHFVGQFSSKVKVYSVV